MVSSSADVAYKNDIMRSALKHNKNPRPQIQAAELEEAKARAHARNRRLLKVVLIEEAKRNANIFIKKWDTAYVSKHSAAYDEYRTLAKQYLDQLAGNIMPPHLFLKADQTVRGLSVKVLAILNNALFDIEIPEKFFTWAEQALEISIELAKFFEAKFLETRNPSTAEKNAGHRHYRNAWRQMLDALRLYKTGVDARKAAGGPTSAADSAVAATANANAIAAMAAVIKTAVADAAMAGVGT